MLRPNLARRAQKYLSSLPEKHSLQITKKITQLCLRHGGNDIKKVIGIPFWRADCGEYRIVFQKIADVLHVVMIGKRNAGDVYRKLDQLYN